MSWYNTSIQSFYKRFYDFLQFSSKLKEENCNAEVVTVMDGEEKEMHYSEKKVFNEFLPVNAKEVW